MALSRVSLPFSYYGSPNFGRPVPFAKIYVGSPDLDPRVLANRLPLVVIQENGTEVNIAPNEQPLLTGAGGYIEYQGSVVEVRVDGDYAIAVDDQNDAQQYYSPQVFDAIDDQDAFYQAANFFENNAASASNAYVIESPNTPRQTQYIDGQLIVFRPSDVNSGASTIEIIGESGGLGAKTATLADGVSALPQFFFNTNYDYYFRYDEALDVLRYSEIEVKPSAFPTPFTPQGHIFGLKTANSSGDVTNDIETGAGQARDTTDTVTMVNTAAFIKQIDANWAAGNNAGGFPSGLTLTVSTWYRYFIIMQPDGTIDFGWDTDANALNLIADAPAYVYFRQIAWHYWEPTNNILLYTQEGDYFQYDELNNQQGANPINTSRQLVTIVAPPDESVLADIEHSYFDGSAASGLRQGWLGSTRQADIAPSTTYHTIAVTDNVGLPQDSEQVQVHYELLMDTNSQLAERWSITNADETTRIFVKGFTYRRGKE